jgi:hypothetical protein
MDSPKIMEIEEDKVAFDTTNPYESIGNPNRKAVTLLNPSH